MNNQPDVVKLVAESRGDSQSPDSVVLAGRRLGIAAALVAGSHLIYTVLYQTVWIADSSPMGLITALIGLVVSAAVAVYLLSATRSASQITAVGVAYEILLGLTLGMSESCTVNYAAPSPQVSWSSVVIVLFPFLLPANTRVVLGASLAAALTTPLAMWIAFTLTGRSWPAPGIVSSFVLPPILCAVLAWAPTRVLSQMAAAVQKARRLGNYELKELLGTGGMGEVWLARHRLLARPAAVKLIKPERLGAEDHRAREILLQRFEREAQVTASLDSLHTVELYDFGISSDGALFYVMELLNGVDVETLVERFGPLPSERVVHLLMQACDSLEDAHKRGLIHRDVKPANMFVSRKGSTVDFVKLLDFGLVKRWNREDDADLVKSLAPAVGPVQATAVGQIVGTPAFLAPEAAMGEKAVDHRADIYALGCVGYWMLTGQYVFAETSAIAMAVAHVTKTPELPSRRVDRAIVPQLETVIMSCLRKNRDERPRSAEALRQALSEVPLGDSWSRERALAWWQQNLAAKSASPA